MFCLPVSESLSKNFLISPVLENFFTLMLQPLSSRSAGSLEYLPEKSFPVLHEHNGSQVSFSSSPLSPFPFIDASVSEPPALNLLDTRPAISKTEISESELSKASRFFSSLNGSFIGSSLISSSISAETDPPIKGILSHSSNPLLTTAYDTTKFLLPVGKGLAL